MNVNVIGIDIAKNVFHLHGIDSQGKVVLKERVSRKKFLTVLSNLPQCLIGMEACSTSNYWGRELTKLGHTVKLISPQYVKPYVKTNKNDSQDAEAICGD
jgi:transposase